MPRKKHSAFLSTALDLIAEGVAKDNPALNLVNGQLEKHTNKYKQLAKYKDYPIAFCKNMLGITLTPKQKYAITLLYRESPKVFITASHSVGKSLLASVFTLHYFFTHQDSITLITAPTIRQVNTVIFAAMRSLNTIDQNVFRGDFANKMYISPSWSVLGFASATGDAVQGVHALSGKQAMILDECVGIKKPIWESILSMDNEDVKILAICNPTDITSHAYSEYLYGNWKRVRISALDHPNILAESKGEEAPFPAAVRLSYIQDLVNKWTIPVYNEDIKKTDVEWPLHSGEFIRPNELFTTRVLGLWHTATIDTVFTQTSLETAFNNFQEIDGANICFGLDVARGGKDFSVLSIRNGVSLLEVVRRNLTSLVDLANLVVHKIKEYAEMYHMDEFRIPINIDTTGVGGGVYDVLSDMNYHTFDVMFGERSQMSRKYPDMRSELWFELHEKCLNDEVDFSRLDTTTRDIVRTEALSPKYSYDRHGRKLLEKKEITRKRLGYSPDLVDSLSLCYIVMIPRISVAVVDTDKYG